MLFIGDSLTDWFNTNKYLNKFEVKNVGVAGDSTIETISRMSDLWFDPIPDFTFICIGTNDMARDRNNSYILDNITKIVKKIPTKLSLHSIYLTSIFPTRDNEPRPNNRIEKFNLELQELAVKLDTKFLNLHPYFIDSEGKLKTEFTEDGLHLTEPAYEKWAELLNEFLKTYQ